MLLRDIPRTRARAGQLLSLSASYQTFKGEPEGAVFESWALQSDTADNFEAYRRMLQAIEHFDVQKNWAFLPYLMSAAAELAIRSGDRIAAHVLIDRAMELVDLTGERWCEAELMRLRAQVSQGTDAERADILRRSIDIAQAQAAKLWELRSSTDLAAILREQGQFAEAAAVLRPICAWFSEGATLSDLIVAQAMLAEVSRAMA